MLGVPKGGLQGSGGEARKSDSSGIASYTNQETVIIRDIFRINNLQVLIRDDC